MDIHLLYGRDGIRLTLPPHCQPTIIEKPPMPVLADPRAAVAAALDGATLATGDQPCGKGLDAIAKDQHSACILICDITRPVPNGLFLRPMIEQLQNAGIGARDITVLVATGLHRPNLGTELAEIVGDPWVLDTVAVVNHQARDDAMHVHAGVTARGTTVRLDRRFVEADVRIATGLVEPHLMAGYSGGRKVITPGIAHAETITTLHNHAILSDPGCTNCNLEGNPLHAEQLEVVDMIGGALALNTVIDDRRRLAFVNFGEIVSTHLEAVAFMRQYAEVQVDQKFKTVVTTGAGYPLDQTFYQTIKAVAGALGILADGGDLIVASRCEEGLGSADYIAAQRRYLELGRADFLAATAKKSHASIDEWQTQLLAQPQDRVRITLYSDGLDTRARRLTGVAVTDDLNGTLAESLARHGDPCLAVIPEGPYVVPFVA